MTSPNQRTRRAALNMMSGLGYTAATIAIAFFTTPLLLRWLGVERYGAARAVTDWFGHLGIFEMGLMGALPALLARTLSTGDRTGPSLQSVLVTGVRAYARVLVFAVLAGLAITLLVTRLVPVSPGLTHDLRVACLVGLAGLLLYPLMPFRWLFDAEQRSYVITTMLLVQSVFITALALVLARADWGITGQLLALAAGQILLGLLLLAVSRRRVADVVRVLAEPPDREAARALNALNWPSLWFMLSGRLGLLTDNIMVAGLLGPSRVVPLYLTQRLLGLAGTQLLAVGGSSWAALAELHAMGRRDTFNARLLDLTRMVAGLAVATLVPLAAFNHAFVIKWVGTSGFGGDAVTVLAALNAFLLALISLWSWVFSGTGAIKLLVPSALASAALNIAVSVSATVAIGLPGPLIGTLVGVAGVSLWYLPLMLQRTFGTPALALARAAGMPLIWGLPIGAALFWLARRHPPATWLALGGELAASGLVLLLFWWAFALTTDERASFRARLGFALGRPL